MSLRFRTSRSLRNWGAEQLESRAMLAGHGFGAMFNAAANVGGFFGFERGGSLAAAAFGPQIAARDLLFGSLGGVDSSQRTVLSANLTDTETGETARVVFQSYTSNTDGTTETELKVSVTGAAADTTLDVTVGDVVVGQVTTDANGNGKLILSSNPEDNEQPLPDGFPADVAAGTAVSVGTLNGTLAANTFGGGCQGENGSVLRRHLSDDTTGASARIHLRTLTQNDVTTTTLVVKVTGAEADSSLDVTIGDVVVGQVTTDSTGAGQAVFSSNPTGDQLPLPDNFPTDIAAGTAVSVGTMTGELALGHGGHHGHWHH